VAEASVQLGEEFAEIILVGVVVADYRGAVARICSLCTLLNTPTKMVGTTHVSPGGEVKTIAIAVTRAAVICKALFARLTLSIIIVINIFLSYSWNDSLTLLMSALFY
jgi:hypothetical protein